MNQGQQMLSSDLNNANQYKSDYSNYQGQANAANQNLQNYTQYMQGQGNPLNLYNQQMQNAFQQQGFNPQSLATATQNLTQSQNALQSLNQAQQQGAGGYGLTGAQLGNYYSTLSSPLQQTVSAQNNAVNNLQQLYQNALTQGQQGATLGFQGEQQTSQNLGQIFQNANAQAQNAMSQMQFYSQLAQSQGGNNAQAQQGYAQALGAYQQAVAAANAANAQAAQTQQQVNMMNEVQKKYGLGGIAQGMGIPASVTNPKPAVSANPSRQSPSLREIIDQIPAATKQVGSDIFGGLTSLSNAPAFSTIRSLF